MIRHDRGDTPAREARVDLVANARLQLDQLLRQVGRDIALLAIDRVQFNGELDAVLRGLASAIAGHATHQVPPSLA